jgi:hypothetical protein
MGLCARAMLRKVWASIEPVTGELFIGGADSVWAVEDGAMSRRDAMTMPMASEATAMSTP